MNSTIIICAVFRLYRDFCQEDFARMAKLVIDKQEKYAELNECKHYYSMDLEECLLTALINDIVKENGFVKVDDKVRIEDTNSRMPDIMRDIWNVVQAMTSIDLDG